MKTIEWISRIQDILEELPELKVLEVNYSEVTELAYIHVSNKTEIEKLGKVRTSEHVGEGYNYTKYYTYIDGIKLFYIKDGEQ